MRAEVSGRQALAGGQSRAMERPGPAGAAPDY